MTLRQLLREPLLHFFAVAALVLALAPKPEPARATSAETRELELSQRRVDALLSELEQEQGRSPTAAERQHLLREVIREEILVREAIALGMHRTDTVVRRRLVQNIEFLSAGARPIEKPTDAQLEAYLRVHEEDFRLPEVVSFEHVFLRKGNADAARVEQLRAQLASGARAGTLGDRFLRGNVFAEKSQASVEGIFGPVFASQLFALKPGDWKGPLESTFGSHLVHVTGRRSGRAPELEQVRTKVHAAWLSAQRDAEQQRALDELVGRWSVRVAGKRFDSASLREAR